LKETQAIGNVSVRFFEKLLGQAGADPGSGYCLIGRELSIEGAGSAGYAAAGFIGVENRPRCGQIPDRSTFSRKTDLVGVADGSRIMLRLASQKQHDTVAYVDTGIIVEALSSIDDTVSDEDDLPLEICGRRIEDGKIV
jgi:hypothetical protein